MKKLYSFLLVLGISLTTSYAQKKQSYNSPSKEQVVPPHRTCATMDVDKIRRANNPSVGSLQDFENWLAPFVEEAKQNALKGQRVVYTIPVVVHVIHNGEAVGSGSNISIAQINSQIDVLNEDYRKLNADASSVPSAYQSRHADVEINFCMALRDPSGVTLTEAGVDRVNRSSEGFSAPPYSNTSYIDGTIKPATIWDPTKYLNMWVLNLGGGLLGYAQFPDNTASLGGLNASGGSANTDGVVMGYTAFGRVGNVSSPYNRGRTATHEVGHWLGLRHIWGDSNCGTDYCSDTPTQQAENYGCPSFPNVTCSNGPNGDMFMNYMDYVDDACMYMFTNDQKARVQAVMAAGTPRRSSLASSTVCNPSTQRDAAITAIVSPSGSTCLTNFTPIVTLGNFGSNTLTSVTINYNVDGGANNTFSWTGSLATNATVNVTLPSITSSVGSHAFTSYTSSPNGGSDQNTANDQSSGSFTITAVPSTTALPFFEGFEATTFVPSGWTLENPNSNNTWSRVTTANGFGNSTASARMDNFSGSTDITGQLDNMLTPGFDFSSAVSPLRMDFNLAHARYNNTYSDSLFVDISINCGASWTRLWSKGGTNLATAANTTSAFVPTSSQWRAETINLDSYIGTSNAKFRFQSKSGYGNHVYVDDINLYYPSALPVANFSASSTSICAGQSVTFTDLSTNSPTSWSWAFTGGTPSSSTQQNPTITYNIAGTYSITLTATNASGSDSETKTSYITVTAPPVISVTPAAPSICPGGSVSLTASGANTYSWSPSTGLSTTTGATVTANPGVTTTYSVTGTSSAGCINTTTVTVTVNSNPTVSVTPSTSTICSGGSVSLTASGASTYSWSPSSGLSSTTGASVTASPSSTTTYTVTGTSAAGCTGTANAVVTINATPVVNITPSTDTICNGASATLTASGATTYTWTPSTGLSATAGSTVTATPTSTTTYTVSGTTGTCSNTANITLAVLTSPTISVTPSAPSVCEGGSVALTASGAITYSWSPSAGLNITTGSTVTASPSATITYTVTGIANGCSNTANVTVTVNPNPVVSVSPASPTICEGNSVSLTASGAATYSWSPSTGLSATTGATVSATPSATTSYTVFGTTASGCSANGSVAVTVTPRFTLGTSSTIASCSTADGTATASVTGGSDPVIYLWNDPSAQTTATATGLTAGLHQVLVSDNNGCVDSASVSVNNATPIVSVNPPSPSICRGETVTLTASGATTYSWSPSVGLSATTGDIVDASPNNSRTYTVTGTTAGCTNSTTVTVTVNNLPNVSVTPSNPAICSGDVVDLTATGASTYSWSPGTGLSATTGTTVTANPASTTTYTVTGTDGNGCQNTVTTTVTVNSSLTVTATSSSDTICSGQSATLSASGAATYTWGPSVGLNTTSGSSVSASPTATTTYTVTGTSGSCSSTADVTVNVKATPLINVTPAAPTICEGSSTALAASGADSYSWSPSTDLNTATGADVIASPVTTTTYTVTGTTNGCSANTDVTVTVSPLPNVAVTPASPTICEGSSTSLAASGASTYSWSPATGLNATSGSTVTANPSATTTYTVTGTQGVCSNTFDVAVTVQAVPVVSVTPNSSTICGGSSVDMNASGATSYSWSPATDLSATTGATVTAAPSSTITYTVTGITNGCSATANATVNVNSNLNLNTSTTLASCSTNDGSATVSVSGGSGIYTYLWNDGISQTTATASNLGAGNYQVIVSDGTCSDSASVTVNNPTPTVIITPSSDTICAGETVSLTASGADSFSWSPSTGLSATTGVMVDATPNATITYTALGSTAGCTNSSTVTITVNLLPAMSVSPSNPTICSGQTVALAASGADIYSWSPSADLNASSGATVTASPTSTTTYTVAGTTAAGCLDSADVTVTVNGVIAVSVSSTNDTICAGESVNLSASGATSYTWSPGTGLSDTTGASITATPTSTTTYYVTGSSTGCSDTDSVTIVVNTIPVLFVSASPSSICAGQSSLLSASGAGSYTWSPSNDLSATTGNNITATPSSTITYTVTGSNGSCSASEDVTVTVNSLPAVAITPSSPSICIGSSVLLTASGASSYSWSPITGLSSANATVVMASPTVTTTYTVTGSNGTCSNSATATVTVNALPTVAVSPASASICAGGSVDLTASGASTYSWTPSATLNSGTGQVVTASPVVNTTYTVTGTNANGCAGTRNVTVSVVVAPTVTITPSSATICNGEEVTLTASGASSYSWTPSGSLSASTGDIVTASPTSTTTYTVTGSASGCVTTSQANVTVTVNSLPSISVTNSNPTFCAGGVTILSASGANTYTWSPVTGLSTSTGSTIGSSPASTTTYTVTGTSASGCLNTADVTVTVNPSPNIVIDPSPASICAGSAVTLTATGANNYTWNPSSSLNTNSGSTVVASPSINTTYTVTGTVGTCTQNKTVTVNVTTKPTVIASTASDTICDGQSVALSASGASSYTWEPTSSLYTSTGSLISAHPEITTTYLVVGSANGCTDSAYVTVNVNPLPKLTVLPDSVNNICEGTSINLSAGGAEYYSWSPALGLDTTQGSAVVGTPASSRVYTVIGTTNGCSSTKSITVNVIPKFSLTANSGDEYCDGDNGTATVFVTGGGNLTYLWNDAALQTTSTATGLSAGAYTVMVSDNYNCSDSADVSVNNFNPVSVSSSVTDVSCYGLADGEATVYIAGENAPVTYLWNDSAAQDSSTAINLVSGVYVVTVEDADGCVRTDTVTISQPDDILAVTSVKNESCNASNGEAMVDVYGGTLPYYFLWNDSLSQTNDTASSLESGTYTVLVTDGKGCSKSVSAVVGSISTMSISFNSTDATCFGGSDASVTADVSGGAAPYTYLWSDSLAQTDKTAGNMAAGTYMINVTDSTGCEVTAEVTLEQAEQILSNAVITDASCGFNNGTAILNTTGGTAPYTYLWNDNTTGGILKEAGKGTFSVLITDSKGCNVIDTLMIEDIITDDCIFIPNAFSPNGDNDHDDWVFYNVDQFEKIKVEVFNRWGNLVYSNDSYLSDWNGTYNGNPLPGGVYFYVIDFNNGEKTINGNVTILR